MIKTVQKKVLTEREFQMISIKDEIMDFVKESGIKNGFVFIMSCHTTAGIMVNENLDCLKVDIEETLGRIIPVEADYAHSHFLPSYGATGGNAPGHLKQMLCGNHAMFPIVDGRVQCSFAQDIFFSEFDGPQLRKYFIQVQGE